MTALDDYLDQLGRELQAPPEERVEILREIRSHLELAVLDMERNGGDNDAQLARTLERFGEAEHIGRELRQVHGRATWPEIGLAALPLLLFSWLPTVLPMPVWTVPLILIAMAVIAWRAHWPLWWWAWLGWIPFAFPNLAPNAPLDLLWVGIIYVLLLLIAQRRGWLEATLTIYPLPTAWALHRVVLSALEIRVMGWNTLPLNPLGLMAALAWIALLARTLSTPSKMARIGKVLQGQVAIFSLNGLAIVAARLWPTYPYPYPYTLRYFFFTTLPYAIYHSLPFLLFFVMTSMPALMALAQTLIRRRPPSRPLAS